MINSYDDLKAQRALAHNDLEVAKSRLNADTRSWKEDLKPLRLVSSVAGNMFTNRAVGKGKKGLIGQGVQLGLNAVIARTALRRLPLPLNIVLPHVLQNVAINYTQKNGKDWLIKGLRWVKKITEEKPESAEVAQEVLVPLNEVDAPLPAPSQSS